ncbi:MAG: hypothetical protein IID33_10015 [Planctomycetes bacterium]|nr:hypothetical protein [Planctomycetota bacterium]
MNEFAETVGILNHAMYVEKVRAARQMSKEERGLAGLRMFDEGCDHLRRLIREQFPDTDDRDVHELLQAVVDVAGRRGIL